LLDLLVGEIQIVQERYQGLKSTVRRKKTELNQLELACDEELNLLKNEYKERIRAEKQKLTVFEEKIINELTKIRNTIDSITMNIQSTQQLIDLKITKLQNQDTALNQFLCKETEIFNTLDKIYIPFYLIQYEKPSSGIRSEIIPPVRIVQEAKKAARIEFYSQFEGIRTKLLTALNEKNPMAEAIYAARERCDYLHKPKHELIVSDVLSWLNKKGIINEKMLKMLQISHVPPFKSIKEVVVETKKRPIEG
jgi:hypothetical protein